MPDLLFYQIYTPVADISTIAICLSYYILLASSYTIKQQNLNLFKKANLVLIFSATTHILYNVYVQRLTAGNRFLVYALWDAAYISLTLVYVYFCIYIRNLIELEGTKRRILDVAVWTGFVLWSLLEIISPVTKWGLYIDSGLQVHQNYFLDIFRFTYLYYSSIVVLVMLTYRKRFLRKMFFCIGSVAVLAFLIMVVQARFMQTAYTCITFTFPIMAVMFLFHYNSYDAVTGTLDSRAFYAHIRDLKGKKFSTIWLYLQDMNMDKLLELREEIRHFNENFFKDCCNFRLRDNKLVMVYENDKNPDPESTLERLNADFAKMYEKRRIDFRMMFIPSDPSLVTSGDYLELNEFLEEQMPLNTVYHCEKKDIEDFQRSKYILEQLRDIHIKQDLNDERVLVYCQPVLNTATNTFTSAEALMRMRLPECGMVFPDQFIPLAEKHEYIHTLSKIILNKTCRQLKEIESQGYHLERVSVNFSILELRDRNFCDDILRIMAHNDMPYDKIAIELTESRNEKDFEMVKNIMRNLQGLGVKFYLDDFGTGYSNFERIIGLPIDIIKFDRSLTILAGKDEESRFLVGSFSDIFKKSNYQILFEGVENEQDETQCKEMNALYLQGYKYSKPIPMQELTRFLKKVG